MAYNFKEKGLNSSEDWVEIPNFLKGLNDGDNTIYLRAGTTIPNDTLKGMPLSPRGNGLTKEDLTNVLTDKIYAKVFNASSILAYLEE